MNNVQWHPTKRSMWRTRIAAIVVTLAAFGLGATFRETFRSRGGSGGSKLAFVIAADKAAPKSLRLLALTYLRRDTMAALKVFDELKSDPDLGAHATAFAEVGKR